MDAISTGFVVISISVEREQSYLMLIWMTWNSENEKATAKRNRQKLR